MKHPLDVDKTLCILVLSAAATAVMVSHSRGAGDESDVFDDPGIQYLKRQSSATQEESGGARVASALCKGLSGSHGSARWGSTVCARTYQIGIG